MKPNLQVRLRSTLSLLSRKAVKKAIHKAFGNLEGTDSKCSNPISQDMLACGKRLKA
ncbi:hypothetical protein WN943_007017 [Citrus x changshan-huyou]